MKNDSQHDNGANRERRKQEAVHASSYGVAVAADISAAMDSLREQSRPGAFANSTVITASLILALGSLVSGVLSIFWEKGAITVETKDILVGALYILGFGGALLFSGGLTAKRALMLAAATVLFQTWNTIFYSNPPVVTLVFALGLWLPAYWTVSDPAAMEKLGLVRKGLVVNSIAGLAIAAALALYMAWGMKNFGFDFKIEPWRLIVNTAQVFPMYLAVFCLFFAVWNKLKSWGASPSDMLIALAFMSVFLSAPSFAGVAIATKTPLGTTVAGLAASVVIMILSTYITFSKFRSAVPAACLFSALAALLLITGLT
ncbi:MAG TPA: hypothetical protein PLK80_04660 [bacterium]|nr:hypothetical protein [bacterium]